MRNRFLVGGAAAAALLASPGARCPGQSYTGPTIIFVFPAGAQRGTTIEAVIAGQNLKGADGVIVSGAGVTGAVTAVESAKATGGKPSKPGKEAPKPRPWVDGDRAGDVVRLTLTVAPDAAVGERDLRLQTDMGPSTRVRFSIDEIPDRTVLEANSTAGTAVRLDTLPVAVNGQLYSGWTGPIGAPDRAYYRFAAKAGETIVLDLRGRWLMPYLNQAVPGWFDACLTLYDGEGRRLAYADDFGFSPDPVLTFKPEKDGEFLLEVRDVIYRSGQDFVYRLRIGALPLLSHVFPLGGRRGATVKVALDGTNLDGADLAVPVPADAPSIRWIAAKGRGLTSNPRPFAAGDRPESVEREPNNAFDKANPVEAPVTVNGRIGEARDEDFFAFKAEAGKAMVFELEGRRLGSPIDSVLTIHDASGAELARDDDFCPPQAVPPTVEQDHSRTVDPRDALVTHQADSRIVHSFAKAGTYAVRVRDIREQGGPDHGYRLTIAPATPDFSLRVHPDAVRVAQGDSAMWTVSAMRKNGFDGDIRIEVGGLPPGFAAGPAVLPAGQEETVLTVSAPADAAPGVCRPRVTGVAGDGAERIERTAFPCESVVQAFYIKHLVPTEEGLVEVEPAAGFMLSTDADPAKEFEVPQGGSFEVTVKAKRLGEGPAKPPIILSTLPKIKEVSIRPNQIPADADEAKLTVAVLKQLAVGTRQAIVISGLLRDGKTTFTRHTPAIRFKVVEPAKPEPKKPEPKKPPEGGKPPEAQKPPAVQKPPDAQKPAGEAKPTDAVKPPDPKKP